MLRKLSTALIIALVFMAAASCSDDPASPEDDDKIAWPGMTARDDVIKVVVLAYTNPRDGESPARYNALLHSRYFFGLAPEDVPQGTSPIMTRAEDIASTEWLFASQTMMELTISPEEGSWTEYPELKGEPCENCYETQRQYFIRVQFEDETTIYQSPPGRAFVVVIVAPDEDDATKWVLMAMYDLGI